MLHNATVSLQVLLSPPIVVYSPRVLPVYVYDAHADCGKNVRFVWIFHVFFFVSLTDGNMYHTCLFNIDLCCHLYSLIVLRF